MRLSREILKRPNCVARLMRTTFMDSHVTSANTGVTVVCYTPGGADDICNPVDAIVDRGYSVAQVSQRLGV